MTNIRTLQPSLFLTLPAETEATLLLPAELADATPPVATEDVVDELLRRGLEGRRELACRQDVLRALAPREDAAAFLGSLTEYKPEEHVEAAESEEEEGSDKREVVDVMREDRGADEALEDAEWPKPEVAAEYGEVVVEEGVGPADLGQDESDDLEHDQDAVDDCPEDTSSLIGYVAITVMRRRGQYPLGPRTSEVNSRNVIAVREASVIRLGLKFMEGLNILGHDENAACEDKHQRDDAESSDGVQAEEYVCIVWSASMPLLL